MAGSNSIGPKIGIEGEKEFRAALQSMGQQLKTLGTEMNAVTSSFAANDKSQEKLAAQSDVLTRQLGLQEQRIQEIQKALDYARANYAENSNEVQRWQQALNNATTDMNKTKQQLDDLQSGVTGVGKDMDEASEKTGKFASTLKTGLAAAAKAAAAAIAASAAAIGALVKQSVEGYGEYEQLVGGVETLFKDSSDTMLKYANDAYKTAGLSANDYMETVTGFSAALLQSLGGDTEKAAQQADMAITDMADNANKMGTSMESIQNAYQGFAKQNYTMLDNLKLGYGGTKEEMQRLLDDASKLSGIEYDLSSYSDIVDAIHVVQTEMGITGTTAKEASTTIQGSVNAAKSAWKNLVTGMADENASLTQLTGNFVDSVSTAAQNIIPRIQTALAGISQVIASASQTIIPMVISTLTSSLPALLEAGMALVSAIGNGIVDNLPALAAAAMDIIMQLSGGLAEALPELIPSIVEIILQIVETLLDNVDQLVDASIAIVEGLAEGLILALPVLIEKAPTIIQKLLDAIVKNVPKLLQAAVEIILSLQKGIIQNIPKLISAIPSVIKSLVDAFTNLRSNIIDVGKNIVEGIWDGIKAMADWLKDKVSDFLGGIVDDVKDVLGIHSPSKVFAGIGENMALGLGQGFTREMQDVSAGMQAAIPTPTVDTVYNAAAGMVNGMAAASAGSGGSLTVNLVLQNGQQIASWLLPDLRDAARNNPEVALA